MQQWSVTLFDELKPDADAITAWQRVAQVLERDPATFERDVRKRLPMTGRCTDEDAAMTLWQALDACGAKALLLPDDGQGLRVRLNGTEHGPVSVEFARHQLGCGAWDGQTEASPGSQNVWRPLRSVLQRNGDADEEPAAATLAANTRRAAASGQPRLLCELPSNSEMAGLHAGFWRRVAAFLVDSLIVIFPLVLLEKHVFGWHLPADNRRMNMFLIVPMWLYWAGFESSSWQATPGKLVLGVSVVDMRGTRIGFLRATGRFFSKFLSTLILYVGYVMVGWTARKQGLHDLIVSTCVVQKRELNAIAGAGE